MTPSLSRKNNFCETSFQLEIGLKNGQKQGRDERIQEDYLASAESTQ